jgi:LacI family transcriptional regulator
MAQVNRINIRQVAEEAGVSHITVSRVLRGQSNVSAATRETVLAVAERLGYKSNPLVQAYAAHIRRAGGGAASNCNLVWLRSHPGQEKAMQSWQKAYYEGALERAAELGYTLDASINAHGLSDVQLHRMLEARGVRGVLLPLVDYFHREPFLHERYATVAIGENPAAKPTHTVTPDYFKDMTTAIDRLLAYGYRRIGFCEHGFHTVLSQGALWGGYCLNQQRMAVEDRLEPLVGQDFGGDESVFRGRFLAWVEREKPDAIVVSFNHALGWLQEAGWRVPEDIALAHMGLGSDVAGWSGVSFSDAEIGSAAVDLLTAHILRNDYGIPERPKHMRLSGHWHDGATTLRPKGKLKAFLPESQSHPMGWFQREFWDRNRGKA